MMKRVNLLLCAGLLCTAAGFSQPQTTGYSIQGNIKGIRSGTAKLSVYNDADRTTADVDSVKIMNGTFHFTGRLDIPQMMSLSISPGNWSLPVFVENSRIIIQGDTAGSVHYDYTAYGMGKYANIKKYTILGSATDKDYNSLLNAPEYKKYERQFALLNKRYEAEKDKNKQEKMRGVFDSLRALQSVWQKGWIDKFITSKPSSPTGAYMLSQYFTANSETAIGAMDSLLNKMTAPANQSLDYKNMIRIAGMRKALLPGNVAPDFTLLKRDSTSFTLSSTRGKYVMIDFWASWCHPCREAIPHWKEVYEKYRTHDFDMVSVSDDSRRSDWIKAMDQEKMPWTQTIDEFPVKNMPSRVGTLYQTHFIPFYVLLDKEGKIILCNPTEKEMDAKLEELFGNASANK